MTDKIVNEKWAYQSREDGLNQGCGVDGFLGDSDSDSDSDPRSRLRLRLRLRDRLRPGQYHELIKDNRSEFIFCVNN